MTVARVGYARTSTLEQEAGFEAQERKLKELGCDPIFKEQVSSVAPRPELERALEYLRKGDTLTVTKLDRLARSTYHLGQILERLKGKGAELHILDLQIDTNSPTGKLMLTVMGGIGQFEREMMLERQKEGIAKAKEEGKYKGRSPTAKAKTAEILALFDQGIGPKKIAEAVGVARSSVYRILEDENKIKPTKENRL